MGIVKTKGIVIAEHNVGDFDKILTILTPDLGKISCGAKGARKPKTSLLAGTSFLSFSDYVLFKSPNSYNINSCELIESFYNIRMDLDKLTYAANISKLISSITNENDQSYRILQLYLNTLYLVSETEKDIKFIDSVFKIRLVCILGFTPIIKECMVCGEKEGQLYFSFKDSGVKCEDCGRQDKSAIKISQGTFNALKYIILSPPKKIFSFEISEDGVKELEIIAKIYLKDKLI